MLFLSTFRITNYLEGVIDGKNFKKTEVLDVKVQKPIADKPLFLPDHLEYAKQLLGS